MSKQMTREQICRRRVAYLFRAAAIVGVIAAGRLLGRWVTMLGLWPVVRPVGIAVIVGILLSMAWTLAGRREK